LSSEQRLFEVSDLVVAHGLSDPAFEGLRLVIGVHSRCAVTTTRADGRTCRNATSDNYVHLERCPVGHPPPGPMGNH